MLRWCFHNAPRVIYTSYTQARRERTYKIVPELNQSEFICRTRECTARSLFGWRGLWTLGASVLWERTYRKLTHSGIAPIKKGLLIPSVFVTYLMTFLLSEANGNKPTPDQSDTLMLQYLLSHVCRCACLRPCYPERRSVMIEPSRSRPVGRK